MKPKFSMARLRRAATITSTGMSILLIEVPWPAVAARGDVRPAPIASTSQVNAPTVSSAGGTAIAPALIASTAQLGAPAFAPAGGVAIAPSLIASTAAVRGPTIALVTALPVAPAIIPSAAFVGAPLVAASGATVLASQMWSSTDKGANYTLSERNLVSTYTSGNGDQLTRAATPGTGKFYFEVTAINPGSPVNMPIGLADSVVATTTFLGGTSRSIGLVPGTGKIFYNNNSTATVYGTFTAGDVIGVAVDRTVSPPVIYYSKNGAWLGSFNPVEGTGGFAVPNMTDFIPAFSSNRGGASARLNTGPTTLFAPPKGFSTLVTTTPA